MIRDSESAHISETTQPFIEKKNSINELKHWPAFNWDLSSIKNTWEIIKMELEKKLIKTVR